MWFVLVIAVLVIAVVLVVVLIPRRKSHNNQSVETGKAIHSYKRKRNSDDLQHSLVRITEWLQSYGINHFVCAGTLLGLVRQGKPLTHDDDVDIAVDHQHLPQLLQMIEDKEATIAIDKPDTFLQVNIGQVAVDFYIAHIEKPYLAFYWYYDETRLCIPLEWGWPAQKWSLPFQLPAKPLHVVTYFFGPRWREKLLRHDYTPHIVDGQLKITYTHEYDDVVTYFNHYFNTVAWRTEPSSFARFVKPQVTDVVELGCGDAVDTAYLKATWAIELSDVILQHKRLLPHTHFTNDWHQVPQHKSLYIRDTLYLMTDVQVRDCLQTLLPSRIFIEERTQDDRMPMKFHQQFWDPKALQDLLATLGYKCEVSEADDDYKCFESAPSVIRLVASKVT
jgi:hypothetical protein